MKRKTRHRGTESPPSLDDVYFRLKLLTTRLEGLSSLLEITHLGPDDLHLAEKAFLGIGAILEIQCEELRRLSPIVSEHALRKSIP